MIRRVVICVPVALLLFTLSALASPLPPQIHTVAGGGSCSGAPATEVSGGTCDNVSATSVPIGQARWVAWLPGGGYLYVDEINELVREVTPSGNVVTVAGNGTTTDVNQPGTLAVQSGLNDPVSVAPLPNGGFLVTEYGGSRVREVSPGPPSSATITTVAGTGTPGDNGPAPGGSAPATSTQLSYPTDAEPLADGSILIADSGNNLIREVSPSGMLSTVAGGGTCDDTGSPSCDGLPAAGVALHVPSSVSPIQGGVGGYLISESGANAVREVSPAGVFSTVAGRPSSSGGYGGDGGPATSAQLNQPGQVVSTGDGGFLVADTRNEVVRDVSPAGTISTVAGTPATPSYSGDGGNATAAAFHTPASISPVPDGGFLVADEDSLVIRRVTIAPTTTIVLSPAAPNGNNGWYNTPVHATTTVVNGKGTQCVLDPPQAPTLYDELPPPCPYTGGGASITGDGTHTLYAASINSFGDKEVPISVTLQIDTTPPTLTCVGSPSFTIGARNALVTATVADQLSGPASTTASAVAYTGALGLYGVTVDGFDQAGNLGRVGCAYTVLPARMKPRPKLKSRFTVAGAHTTVAELVVAHVPAQATVELVCKGGGCPLTKTKLSTHRRHGRKVSLTRLLAGARLAAGAQLTVSVTKPNTIGRTWRLTIRSGRAPTSKADCLEPGSSVPGRGCSAH